MQENLRGDSRERCRDTSRSLLSQIRDLVLDGSYSSDEIIPEQALAEAYGVSRTPIREALKQLENEGLVEIRARVGTFVRYPTRREVIELFQVKESLEGLAANLLAQRAPTEEIEKLQKNVQESFKVVDEDDGAAYARLVHEFHWTLVLGSKNQKLIENYDRLMNQLTYHRLVLETVSVPGRIKQSIHEHQAVVEAIIAQDPMGAELAMRNHVHASSRFVLYQPHTQTVGE
ncbi:GntR family transcriptional regulator [Enteractinococcus coprophilus]|uniref:GntR family transcriptional regulator n=2 Tax=Enteractinococcus coprophilus TaxID=1027633 RepID=A0A543AMS1_9MICC|nr:GntR family transcriptional regulator [Enteractinococcus coprophilus]TQL73873.1 GntR family transcriptional regulator [Enteractinococcus coprophilus]